MLNNWRIATLDDEKVPRGARDVTDADWDNQMVLDCTGKTPVKKAAARDVPAKAVYVEEPGAPFTNF
jgi:glyceraldehyde-3-phosphate dehydrogenase/erythrose-4-phosphate dehydrogenase